MAEYRCWLTIMFESQVDQIISGLVSLGYTVGPGIGDGASHDSSGTATIVIINVSHKKSDIDALHNDLDKVLKTKKILYYSSFITSVKCGPCRYQKGNIVLPETPAMPTMPVSESDV